MIKLVQRLLIFFIGIPAVAALIICFPQRHHLAVNIAVIIVSAIGAAEFSLMFKKIDFTGRSFPIVPFEAAILGALSPLSMTLSVSFDISSQLTPAFFIIGASWLLVSGIFFHKNGDFSRVINRLAAGFSVMMYPSLFLSWIVRMGLFRHSAVIILTFILTVMANDSTAWAFGMLFGKGNRGIVKVSPNKSVAGFIGGMAASIIVCVGAVYILPDAFTPDQIPALPSGIILGLLSGIAVSVGDLGESAIKRACDIKDSGFIIPGRGGVLDSVDSIAFTAPVFFILYRFLF
jgi:phosphatidate cytidylyltransferase